MLPCGVLIARVELRFARRPQNVVLIGYNPAWQGLSVHPVAVTADGDTAVMWLPAAVPPGLRPSLFLSFRWILEISLAPVWPRGPTTWAPSY